MAKEKESVESEGKISTQSDNKMWGGFSVDSNSTIGVDKLQIPNYNEINELKLKLIHAISSGLDTQMNTEYLIGLATIYKSIK